MQVTGKIVPLLFYLKSFHHLPRSIHYQFRNDVKRARFMLRWWENGKKTRILHPVTGASILHWHNAFSAFFPRLATTACDPVVEEHFRRSLGKNYKEPEPVANSVSITGSVDDHFAKALGDTWLQIKAAKDGVSSSPESASRRGQSSPSSHMVNHNHSPSVVSWREDRYVCEFAWFDWALNSA